MNNDLFIKSLCKLRDSFTVEGKPEGIEACNLLMTAIEERPLQIFILSKKEAEDLNSYFLQAGYISHEFHQSIHDLTSRLMKFVRDNK